MLFSVNTSCVGAGNILLCSSWPFGIGLCQCLCRPAIGRLRSAGMRGAQLFEEFCLGHYENGAKFSPRKEHCEVTYSQTLSLLPRIIERAKELDVRVRAIGQA